MRALAVVVATGCGFTSHEPSAIVDATRPVFDGPAVGADATPASPDAPPPSDARAACATHQLVASRDYAFIPTFVDAVITDLSTSRLAVLPAELPVSNGNAANRCARITFRNELFGSTQCLYQGGASSEHVGSDPVEIAAGRAYTLRHCKSGLAISFADCGGPDLGAEAALAAGSSIPFHQLTMRVDDGDDEQGPTQITTILEICDS